MNDSEKWDRLFRQALASDEEPEETLNESVINRIKGRSAIKRTDRKRVYRKRLSAVVLVALLTVAMSVTAFAAVQLLSSRQVAEHLGERMLAKAFDSRGAIQINRSVAAGGYKMTLHGIVSGAGLNAFDEAASDIRPERTYAVVSVAKQDGSPMPDTRDPDYGKDPFFISPLVKGLKPWQVNIATMNGGYSEFVVDGIMYRLIECDGVEMFADRGVYLAISSGGSFYSNEAFAYNESTGEINPKADYNGVALLFPLPLDKSKADPDKAAAYLQDLLKEPSTTSSSAPAVPADPEEAKLIREIEELKSKIPDGTVIPESVKEVTYDNQGRIHYEHDDWSVTMAPSELFAEGQTGVSDAVQFSGDGTSYKALQFSKDANGVITGKIINLK